MIEYDPVTVSYAWELTSVSMCYSQGDGFNTSLFKISYLNCTHGHLVVAVVVSVVSVWYVWLCSVARSCATQDDVNKDYVCTLTTSLEINRPPHL